MLFLLSPPRFGSRDAPDASSIHASRQSRGSRAKLGYWGWKDERLLEVNGRRRPFSVSGAIGIRVDENV